MYHLSCPECQRGNTMARADASKFFGDQRLLLRFLLGSLANQFWSYIAAQGGNSLPGLAPDGKIGSPCIYSEGFCCCETVFHPRSEFRCVDPDTMARTDASKFFGDKDYYFASFWAVWQINSGVTLPPNAEFLSPDLHQWQNWFALYVFRGFCCCETVFHPRSEFRCVDPDTMALIDVWGQRKTVVPPADKQRLQSRLEKALER